MTQKIRKKNKVRKTSLVKKKVLKKTVHSKKKKTNLKKKNLKKQVRKKVLHKKKPVIRKTKKISKKITKEKIRKKKKEILSFDDRLKEIVTKLIEKNKIKGIYTSKIIEKSLPKKFRIPENVAKVESFLKKNNITVLLEEEAKKIKKEKKEKIDEKTIEENLKEEKKQTGKTDDPVRLYLRDMGSVELLSREGEIAIAKRIEAGREKMIGAICESPMTIRSIINWKDSIKEGTMLLRDIVDLEQTYDMSDVDDSKDEDTLRIIEGGSEKKYLKTKENVKKKKLESNNEINPEENENGSEEKDEDDEEESLNVSLAAMEEKLKPKVLKDFDDITKLFKKLQKSSMDLITSDNKNSTTYVNLEKKYKRIQKEMVIAMKAVHFNSSTIEALMESLYELNKKLLVREGRMLRLATSEGVKRESFISIFRNFLTLTSCLLKIEFGEFLL